MIAVVDYGVGNLRNVYKALEAGASARIVTSPGGRPARRGSCCPVSARAHAALTWRGAGLPNVPALDAIAAGTPLLGICVGMQLLFDESEEMGRHPGLGVIPGRVVQLRPTCTGPTGGC